MNEIKKQYEAFVEKWKLQGGTEMGRAVFDCSEELIPELQELMRAVADKSFDAGEEVGYFDCDKELCKLKNGFCTFDEFWQTFINQLKQE